MIHSEQVHEAVRGLITPTLLSTWKRSTHLDISVHADMKHMHMFIHVYVHGRTDLLIHPYLPLMVPNRCDGATVMWPLRKEVEEGDVDDEEEDDDKNNDDDNVAVRCISVCTSAFVVACVCAEPSRSASALLSVTISLTFMTREPGTIRFTNSPRCMRPTTESRLRKGVYGSKRVYLCTHAWFWYACICIYGPSFFENIQATKAAGGFKIVAMWI